MAPLNNGALLVLIQNLVCSPDRQITQLVNRVPALKVVSQDLKGEYFPVTSRTNAHNHVTVSTPK